MNKQTLIWTLVVAVFVGVAALATGYIYRGDGTPSVVGDQVAEGAPGSAADAPAVPDGAGEQSVSATNTGQEETETAAVPAGGADSAPAEDAGKAPVSPSFDVVGVEPTGETVVAGRSDAGAIVALVANGKVVGKSIANQTGEWTIILDAPLKPGEYDVGLEVHDETGAPVVSSEERLAVSIPEGGREQPLVVLNTPDGPSGVLQKPEPDTPAVVAEAPAAETQSAAQAPAARTETAAAEETVAASRPEASAAEDQAGGEPRVAALDTSSETAAVDTGPAAASGAGTADASGAQEDRETEPAAGTAPATAAPAQQAPGVADGETQTAAADTVPVADAGTAGAPTITVEAVESEPDKVFVAGTGEPGSAVRVYVGDEFQGEAQVNASGRWLVEGDKTLEAGNVEVRADLIGRGGDKVDARAAVTFEKAQTKQVVLSKVIATGTGSGSAAVGADVQKALPVVIIRKGDNLWRISRRLYGDGVRYTTIYQANQDQIRDPDLIYPGQVFLTPEGDLNWPPAPEDDGRNG